MVEKLYWVFGGLEEGSGKANEKKKKRRKKMVNKKSRAHLVEKFE